MHSFLWLYVTINAPDFQLIPLDRNTYYFIYQSSILEKAQSTSQATDQSKAIPSAEDTGQSSENVQVSETEEKRSF